jgi:hypothetical protein
MMRKITWTLVGFLGGVVAGKGVDGELEFLSFVAAGILMGFGLAIFLEKRAKKSISSKV